MLQEILSPAQLSKMSKGEIMKPFIAPATRTKCSGCGGDQFQKKKSKEFENLMPSCLSCGKRPEVFRIGFLVPVIGGKGFRKLYRTTDHKGRKLDSPSRADAFCEYIREKLTIDGDDFDPRELGTREEREFFLVKNCSDAYLEFHKSRTKKRDSALTPGGYAKKERLMRCHIKEIFGEFTVKELTYQVINRKLALSSLTDSVKSEVLTELSPFFKWACMEGLIKSSPELPKKPKGRKFKATDFYTLTERNLVINNIKKRNIKIAIMILANYTRRKSEVICLRWGDVNFKTREITFSRHVSDGKGKVPSKELKGLKSSPESFLKYDFFPGLYEMLMEMTPSLDPKELVFKNKNGEYIGKNVFYETWKRSVEDLINKLVLNKFVDLHRGTRNSTLSALFQNGVADSILVELYGGDMKTMKDHYAKKSKQNLGEGWKDSVHLIK